MYGLSETKIERLLACIGPKQIPGQLFTMPVRPTNEYTQHLKCSYRSVFNLFQRCPLSGRLYLTSLHAYRSSSRIIMFTAHLDLVIKQIYTIYGTLFHQANLSAMFNEKRYFSSDDAYCQCCDNVEGMLAPSQSITWHKICHVRQVILPTKKT